MTVNELEQALRNLIASQPMLSSGPNGEVINSVLMVVYSYRELAFKVQNYPYQDTLKYNMINEIQKLENNLVISVCQVMQERGINIMLYAPQNQFNPGVGQSFVRPTSMQTPMNYGAAPMGMNYGQMNMQYVQNANPQMYAQPVQQADYRYAPQQTVASAQPQQTYPQQPQPQQRKATAAPYPKAASSPTPRPTTTVIKPKPVAPSTAKKPEETPKEIPQEEEQTVQKPSKKAVVDALVGDYSEPTEKAAGRDYLLELLKK